MVKGEIIGAYCACTSVEKKENRTLKGTMKKAYKKHVIAYFHLTATCVHQMIQWIPSIVA